MNKFSLIEKQFSTFSYIILDISAKKDKSINELKVQEIISNLKGNKRQKPVLDSDEFSDARIKNLNVENDRNKVVVKFN